MSEAEQRPGRRRAGPVKPPPKPKRPRDAARAERYRRWGWLALVAAAAGVLVADQVSALPDVVRQVAAGALLTLLAGGLAIRTGGRPLWALILGAGLATAAFTLDWDPLLAGASIALAVLAGALAVMATVPAATFQLAIREALVATLVAAVGALGVAGFGAGEQVRVSPERFGYAVLAIALVGSVLLVYRLGAGLHGLGRRGYALIGGALLMVMVTLAYSEALEQWGSADLQALIDDARRWFRDNLRAVPHPIAALLGYPAIVWGTFMRARRRQGWWVCAFGVAATAPATTRLVDPTVGLGTTLLSAVYSLLVGLALGYLAIRAEQSVTGTHGRRARRDEEAAAHRPEPGRLEPLH